MSTNHEYKLEQAAHHVREYGLGDTTKAWLQLMVALVEAIKDDLVHAAPERVAGLQAQARQLQALQDVATSNIPVNGRA